MPTMTPSLTDLVRIPLPLRLADGRTLEARVSRKGRDPDCSLSLEAENIRETGSGTWRGSPSSALLVQHPQPDRRTHAPQLVDDVLGVLLPDVGDRVADALVGLEVLARDVDAVGGQDRVDLR